MGGVWTGVGGVWTGVGGSDRGFGPFAPDPPAGSAACAGREGGAGVYLRGRRLWGQFQSSYRAVAGDCKSGLGGGYWRLEMRLGYGNAFGVEPGPESSWE